MINSLFMNENTAKIDRLLPNQDQAKFWSIADRAVRKLAKQKVSSVDMVGYRGPGYIYQDFVITIKAKPGKQTYEIYRNRTGEMVLSVDEGKMVARNYEYIFVENHLNEKIGERVDG